MTKHYLVNFNKSYDNYNIYTVLNIRFKKNLFEIIFEKKGSIRLAICLL